MKETKGVMRFRISVMRNRTKNELLASAWLVHTYIYICPELVGTNFPRNLAVKYPGNHLLECSAVNRCFQCMSSNCHRCKSGSPRV